MGEYDKPRRAEEEYFARQGRERWKKWGVVVARRATQAQERIKQGHWTGYSNGFPSGACC